jgi:hypothetical protein
MPHPQRHHPAPSLSPSQEGCHHRSCTMALLPAFGTPAQHPCTPPTCLKIRPNQGHVLDAPCPHARSQRQPHNHVLIMLHAHGPHAVHCRRLLQTQLALTGCPIHLAALASRWPGNTSKVHAPDESRYMVRSMMPSRRPPSPALARIGRDKHFNRPTPRCHAATGLNEPPPPPAPRRGRQPACC